MSDPIEEDLLSSLNVPFKFWSCPSCTNETVTWEGDIAACDNCGRSNQTQEALKMDFPHIKPLGRAKPDILAYPDTSSLRDQLITLLLEAGYTEAEYIETVCSSHKSARQFEKVLEVEADGDFTSVIKVMTAVQVGKWGELGKIPFATYYVKGLDYPFRFCSQEQAIALGAQRTLELVEEEIEEVIEVALTSWKVLLTEKMHEVGDYWENLEGTTASEGELLRLFEAREYRKKGKPFTLWTRDHVYFALSYDGRESVACVPRNPCDTAVYVEASEN